MQLYYQSDYNVCCFARVRNSFIIGFRCFRRYSSLRVHVSDSFPKKDTVSVTSVSWCRVANSCVSHTHPLLMQPTRPKWECVTECVGGPPYHVVRRAEKTAERQATVQPRWGAGSGLPAALLLCSVHSVSYTEVVSSTSLSFTSSFPTLSLSHLTSLSQVKGCSKVNFPWSCPLQLD